MNSLSPFSAPHRGFTLIELAIVLFVLALLLGGLLAPLAVRHEQGQRNVAERDLESIREALLGYVVVNGSLPCPDCRTLADGACSSLGAEAIDDGVEDREVDGTCTSSVDVGVVDTVNGTDDDNLAVGNLPWSSLGVPQNDPWSRRVVYLVTSSFADRVDGAPGDGSGPAPPCSGNPRGGVSFELCSNGNMTIRNRADAGGVDLLTNVPVVALSYGSNGGTELADLSTHEQENQNGDATIVLKPFSRETSNEFDDVVIWISPNILINRMIMAERLP